MLDDRATRQELIAEVRRLERELERARDGSASEPAVEAGGKNQFGWLFGEMHQGVGVHELVYDAYGAAVDYRLLDANQAYGVYLGRDPDASRNRLMSEVSGTSPPPHLDVYEKVVTENVPAFVDASVPGSGVRVAISAFALVGDRFVTIVDETQSIEGDGTAGDPLYREGWEQWVDAAGRVIYVSTSCEAVTGHRPESFSRDPMLLEKITFPEDRHLIGPETHADPEHGNVHTVTFRIISRNGEMKWIRHVCRPAFGPDGSYIGRRSYNSDASAQIRAEDALRESEERHRAIVSAIPDLLFRYTFDGVCLDYSSPSEDLLAVPPEAIIGENIRNLGLPTGFLERFFAAVEGVKSTGEPVTFEYELEVPRGLREFEGRLAPCGEDQVIMIARDVTRPRQAERELRASEARYHAIVEDQTDLILRYTPQGILTFVNRAYARMTGHALKSTIGGKVWDLMPQNLFDSVKSSIAAFSEEEPVVTSEGEIHFPQMAEPRWIEWTSRAVFDENGQVSEIQSVGRDATERKRFEESLRLSEAKFRHIYDYSPVMMHSIDRQGRICDVNRKWLSEMGYSRDEVIGQPASFLMTEESARRAMGEVIPRFWRDGFVRDVPYEYRRKDGEVREVLLNCVATTDPEGNEVSLTVVVDVTEHNHIDRELAEHRERLEQLVEERTAALGRLNEQLRDEIRDRRAAEEALRASEQEYRRLYDTAQVGLIRVELPDGQPVAFNRFMVSLLAYPSRDVFEREFRARDHYVDKELFDEISAALERDGEVRHREAELVRRDGERIWIDFTARVVAGGTHVESVIADATARKEAELQLRESDARYRRLYESTQAALIRTTVDDGQVLECNQRALEMFGYSSHEDILEHFRAVDHYADPAERENVVGELREHGEISDLEVRLQRRDGTLFHARLYLRLRCEEQCIETVVIELPGQLPVPRPEGYQ